MLDCDGTYMPHVTADLPDFDEEIQRGHPFVGAQADLSCEIVEMGHQTGHDIFETFIGALRVDDYRVLGDIINI